MPPPPNRAIWPTNQVSLYLYNSLIFRPSFRHLALKRIPDCILPTNSSTGLSPKLGAPLMQMTGFADTKKIPACTSNGDTLSIRKNGGNKNNNSTLYYFPP